MSVSRIAITGLFAFTIVTALAAEIAPLERRSGFDEMSRDTQAMQSDDAANPGMLWVGEGEALWGEKAGASGKACSTCHGDARTTMKGVAARYPAWDAETGRALDLEARIGQCRAERQEATPLAGDSRELLALTAYVAHQSRGLPITPSASPQMSAVRETGHALFTRRQGQLNLSCAACHDEHRGGRLAGSLIPQGHANGYPLYRLEWQSLGSLQRRLRNCTIGVRAEPLPAGSPDLIALQAYLMSRAAGLPIETPAVRP